MTEKLFNVTAKAVIIRGAKVLIVKNQEDHWVLPGGRFEDDESFEEVLTRELGEEFPNIKNIALGELLSVFRLPKDIKPGISMVMTFFAVTADFEGDVQISEELTGVQWATQATAMALVYESCHEAITNAFQKTKITQ